MVEIKIELPLPIDITGTLINIIGLTYPGAMIKDGGKGRPHWDNRLVLEIPDAERHNTPKRAEKYAKRKAELTAESDSFITELGPDSIGLGMPEYLTALFLAMAKTWFAAYPEAENYMETKVYDRETYKSWIFTVARSEDQTPHALRKAAEQERDALQARLDARIDALTGDTTNETEAPDDD